MRTQSKGARILEMIGRAKGATLAEIMTRHRMASSQRAGVYLHGRQEARGEDRVLEE